MKLPLLCFLLFASILLFTCQRKAVHKEHPEFIGNWVHHDDSGEHWYMYIKDNSYGSMNVQNALGIDMNKFGENPSPRRWRYNDKKHLLTLHFVPDKFHVDQLPTTAATLIINEKDTIQAGETYCILDGNYFLKRTD